MDRRAFIKGSAALGVTTLAGCACPGAPSIPTQALKAWTDTAGLSVSNTLILKPVSINHSGLTSKVIDPHCHIYNATDWQIAGAMRGPFAYSKPEPLRTSLMQIADGFEALARAFSPSATEEYERLGLWSTFEMSRAQKEMKSYVELHNERKAEAMAKLLNGTDIEITINEILSKAPRIFTDKPHDKLNELLLLDIFQNGSKSSSTTGSISTRADRLLKYAFGLLEFFGDLTSPRFRNLLKYQKANTTGSGAIGVDTCYAAILDFDYWIGKCDHAYSSLDDQVLLMARISELSNGYMKPLVAYNPWTDIENNDDSLIRVKQAISTYKFSGVKIYPHMGYYPSGNTAENYPEDGKHPDLELLNEKLSAFFTFCNENNVPIQTHASNQMARKPSHTKMGSPKAWAAFFKSAENAGTKINLSHIGGEHDLGTGLNSWPSQFADVMRMPGAKNLYGDFGMWPELARGDAATVARLIALLAIPLSGNETIADRLMFGSDWFMLSFTGNWKNYALDIQKALSNAGVPGHTLEKIYHENAARLFAPT
jgi:predicted TIM-barrel fold metal-dependent hydrolase